MYKLVRAQEDFDKIVLTDIPLFVDTETCEEQGKTKPKGGLYGAVRLIQLYQEGWSEAIIIDCFFIDLDLVLDKIKPFHHIYHNASYDIHTINCHTDSLWLPKEVDDTFYLSKTKFYQQQKFGFYDCLKYAGLEDNNIRSIDKKQNQTADWSIDLSPTMLKYAAMDVLYLWLLYDKVKDCKDKAYKLDIDNLKYSIEYDRVGIPINQNEIARLRRVSIAELEKYKSLIPVNPNSPKQCSEWLGISSTSAEILGTMSLKGSKDAENLVLARKHSKLLSFINKYDYPRMYGFHNSCGARTSRMTCSGGDRLMYENLQNPPHAIFSAIQSKPGKVIVYKDYSGLELRMAVAYVGETTMSDLMKRGEDMHTATGCELFNKTPETLTFNERTTTKFFNFGTAYGAGQVVLQGLLQAKGRILIDLKDVGELREKWLKLYSCFGEWHKMHKRHFNVYGYLDTVTALGREMRALRLTDSFNFPIQGSAAEVTKTAVHLLYDRYKTPDIINVVHDSIALEKDEDEAEVWIPRLNECMIDAWYEVISGLAIPDLPMPAEAKIITQWGD